jgi:Ca-activated chloride channel family protein
MDFSASCYNINYWSFWSERSGEMEVLYCTSFAALYDKKGSERLKIVMQVLSFFIISIAVFGLAGPTWKKIELPEKILETPLIILLDLSQSMMTDDIQPNRLERAKFKISDFLEANPKVRVGLVGFSGTAHTLVPLTKDYKIIESYLKNITTNVLPFQGTDLEQV